MDTESASPFSLFRFSSDSSSRTAISYIGPRIKFLPFKKIRNLSILSTFMLPVAIDQEGGSSLRGNRNDKPFLSNDRFLWMNRIFFDKPLSQKFQLFVEVATWLSIDSKLEKGKSFFESPTSVFLSYFPTKRITLYSSNQFWPSYGGKFLQSYFYQSGFGAKFQLLPGKIELEGLLTKFLLGKNTGVGTTFNFGIRYIH